MTTNGWYGPAIDDHAASDAGAFTCPVTVGVLHTTESPLGKYRSGGPNNYGNFGHTNFPHFTADVQLIDGVRTFRAFQHISIRHAAKALKNLPGGVQTNTKGAVQIEVVGSATRPFTDDPVMVAGLAKLMRWIESQTQIAPRCAVSFRAYPASYGSVNGVRLSNAAWSTYNGWLGHQHVPENDHGDPGAIDVAKLLPARTTTVKKVLAASTAVVAAAAAAVVVVVAPAPTPAPPPAPRPATSAPAHVDRHLGYTNPQMTGQDVLGVRHALHLCDPRLPEATNYDLPTAQLVYVFQRHRGITERGVGEITWRALRKVAHAGEVG